ncbi:MAG: hypothetical protein JOZ72_08035 [Alphaproteobacteria bacterium]|nr:hypothetical protein [Alphaproteobacteria bacterium]
MSPISFRFVVSALAGAALVAAAATPASAGGFYTGGGAPGISVAGSGGGFGSVNGGYGGGGGGCHDHPIIINKNININKNLNLNKNININKVVVINKINVQVAAFAQAMAEANAQAGAQVIVYGGGSYEYVNIHNNSDIGAVAVARGHCEMQDATVVKSIHAVCIAADGREFPATHMTADTWIESSYEGEVARCIAGARLKIVMGDVVQSDQGMAGLYSKGVILQCGEGEAVRHFKDGMLKCAPAMSVVDCTERTNLRKYGTGDMFFTFRTRVCADMERNTAREVELDGNALNSGGVGDSGGY